MYHTTMKTSASAAAAWLFAFPQLIYGYYKEPELYADPNTIPICNWWHNNDYGGPCWAVGNAFNISPRYFHIWNPSISLDCQGWTANQSYCIGIASTLRKELVGCYIDVSPDGEAAPLPNTVNVTAIHNETPLPVDITGLYKNYAKLDADSCQWFCFRVNDKDFLFSGVKNGNECWCGHALNVGVELAVSQDECDMQCTEGNPADDCGGKNRISVYRSWHEDWDPNSGTTTTSKISTTTTTTTANATPRPTPSWTPIGCYLDSANSTRHTITTKSIIANGASLTVSKCQDACYAENASAPGNLFAGVARGDECWCGETLGKWWANSTAECNVPCSGDASQLCGGRGFVDAYEAVYPATTASKSAATSSSSASSGTSKTSSAGGSMGTPTAGETGQGGEKKSPATRGGGLPSFWGTIVLALLPFVVLLVQAL